MHESQRLVDSPRRKEGPEKQTIPEEIPHFDHVFGKWGKRVDQGTVIRLAPERWDVILFDRCSVYTGEEEELRPRVKVGNKPLNHRHICPRDQPVEVRLRDKLQPKDRFKVVSGKGEAMLVAQDHNADEMLKAGGVQLSYRYFETVQHTDYNLRNRKPQRAAHQERLVAMLLLGATLSTKRWFMTGNDFSLGGVIEPYLAIQYASPSARERVGRYVATDQAIRSVAA
ncbi:hypothetical protein F2Q70_00035966 [Brassica cretica]|uniref:Uncharacterized protein n=1 Tax=Brassica cretica TaxID=69181 RepID=A0A8S9JTJ9_BRACR|nr:hypothetical protein F2Q70_00035966 [Brassica cretica]